MAARTVSRGRAGEAEVWQLGADLSHEGGAGVALAGAVVGFALAEVGVALEGEVLVVADEMGDAGEAGDQVADEGDVGGALGGGEREALEVADVLDADGEVVEADDVAGHPGLGHEADDGAVAVDEEVGGDVEVAGAGDDLAAAFDGGAIEVAPGAVQVAAAGVVQDDELRVDEDVAGGRVLVALAVGDRLLAAVVVVGDRALDDRQGGDRGRGGSGVRRERCGGRWGW
jgi:hypothetical protein